MKIDFEKTEQNILNHDTLSYYESTDLALSIIEYIDTTETTNLDDALCDAINNEVMYYDDQWAIIHAYICPDDIGKVTFQELLSNFIDDLASCIVIKE